MSLPLDDQVRIIEKQIHSDHADFNLFEKLQYINSYFKPDPDFSQEAIDIAISNISKALKGW